MAEEKPKRRLPVLQASTESAEIERPGWHAALLGAIATLLVWLLLGALLALFSLDGLAATLANLLTLSAASFGAGFFTRRVSLLATRRHAAIGAALASSLAFGVAFGGTLRETLATPAVLAGLALTLLVLLFVSSISAIFGFRTASRRSA